MKLVLETFSASEIADFHLPRPGTVQKSGESACQVGRFLQEFVPYYTVTLRSSFSRNWSSHVSREFTFALLSATFQKLAARPLPHGHQFSQRT